MASLQTILWKVRFGDQSQLSNILCIFYVSLNVGPFHF